MTPSARDRHPDATRKAFHAALLKFGIVLGLLLGLLVASALLAHAPLGSWTNVVTVGIALVQAGAVGVLSMGLDRTTSLNRATAGIAFLFLALLFAISLSDLFTRL